MFDIFQNFLQSTVLHPFLVARNRETQGCHWDEVKQIKYIFVDKQNSRTRFGALLYFLNSSSFSHFFSKTNLRKYFFKCLNVA